MSNRSIKRAIRDLETDIENDIDRAMLYVVLPNGVRVAQDTIRAHDRVWHEEVLNSFRRAKMDQDPAVYRVWNYADHAATVNDGRRPGARPPPTYALVPWVVDHAAVLGVDITDPDQVVEVATAIAFNIAEEGQAPVRFIEAMENYIETNGERDLESYFNSGL